MQAEYDGSNDGSTTEDEIDHPERQTEGDGFNDEFDDDAKYYCVVSTAPAEKQWCGSNVISQQRCALRCQPRRDCLSLPSADVMASLLIDCVWTADATGLFAARIAYEQLAHLTPSCRAWLEALALRRLVRIASG
jgi:hypothetical protein